MADWKRDSYYRTRSGGRVRLICTDAPGNMPLVFLGDCGEFESYTAAGSYYASGDVSSLDIIGPWVEPVKPLELWVNDWGPADDRGYYETEADARSCALGAERIAVHMREVLP